MGRIIWGRYHVHKKFLLKSNMIQILNCIKASDETDPNEDGANDDNTPGPDIDNESGDENDSGPPKPDSPKPNPEDDDEVDSGPPPKQGILL